MDIYTEHKELVSALKKPGDEILETINADQLDVIHMVMGICGEAGELLDAVKKWAIYGKDIDFKNVVEELGDIEFFLEGFRQVFDLEREITLKANILKLKKRYASGSYSDEEAQGRADKAEEERKAKQIQEIIDQGGAVFLTTPDGKQSLMPVSVVIPIDCMEDDEGTVLVFVYQGIEQQSRIFKKGNHNESDTENDS